MQNGIHILESSLATSYNIKHIVIIRQQTCSKLFTKLFHIYYFVDVKIHIYKRTCTPMFIEAAFITAKNWKPPKCLTTGEWNANCSLLIYRKVLSHSVMSDSSWPHGLWPTKLFCPWGFSRQEYWSRLPCPPSGIFPPQGSNPSLPHCRQIFLTFWAIGETQKYWSG